MAETKKRKPRTKAVPTNVLAQRQLDAARLKSSGPEKRELVLGVDLDGVCARFDDRIRDIAAEWLGKNPEQLKERENFDFVEWGIDQDEYENLHRFAVVHRELYQSVVPFDRAPSALRRLSRAGIRIRIITSRLFVKHLHNLCVRQTVDWLDHHGVPYWDICFTMDKTEVGAHVYVEDAMHNINNLREMGRHVIVFAAPVNRHAEGPRVDNWRDIEILVQDFAREHGFNFEPYEVP